MNKTALAVRKNNQRIRLAVQVVFFSLIALTSVNHFLAELGIALPLLSAASLHSLCPFGGVVTIYTLLTTGRLVQKVHSSALVMLGLAGITSLLFGAAFCGWICPLGSVQEWLGKLGRKLFKKRYNHFLPPAADRVLGYFRYAVLAWVLYVTARSGMLVFEAFDPYYALFHFWRGEVALSALVILGVTLIGSLFAERPWCRFACPLGGLLGLFNLIRIFRIRRNPATCINCNLCTKACPMKIDVAKGRIVRDLSCNTCLQCTSDSGVCPVSDTVHLTR